MALQRHLFHFGLLFTCLAPVWAGVDGSTKADSYRLATLPVSLIPPRPLVGCLDSTDIPKVGPAIDEAIQTDGIFSLTNETGNGTTLRLSVDSLDGLCQIRAVLYAQDRQLEAHRSLAQGETALGSRRLAQVLSDLGWYWLAGASAKLQIGSPVSGVQVRLNGTLVGQTPLLLERMRPGTYAVELSSPGWQELRENLTVTAGSTLQKEYSLMRTQAWLDSVKHAAMVRHRDSLWSLAKSRPSTGLDGLYAQLLAVDLPAGKQPVAILPFAMTGQKLSDYDAGTMAAEYGTVRLAKDKRFLLVERDGVNALLKEQALIASGAVNDSGAAQAGKLLAARYLISGNVQVNGSTQTITARMVSVETGEIVSAALATVGQDKIEDLYRTAIGERGQLSSALYRSAVAPGWGQFYTGHPVHGSVALIATLGSLGLVGWSYADYGDKDATYKKFRNDDATTVVAGERPTQWIDRAEQARRERNDAATQVNVSLAVVGAVWVANLVDAGVLGYQESRRIRSEYFSWVPQVKPQANGMLVAWRF